MFKSIKRALAIRKANRLDAEGETLFAQSIMSEPERQHAFKPNKTLNLDHIYVYTVMTHPHRLMLSPIAFNLIQTNKQTVIKTNVDTAPLTQGAFMFGDTEDNNIDDAVSTAIADIKNGIIPATLDKNEAIRTVNNLNAERHYLQKKYKLGGLDTQLFAYTTLKDVFEAITEKPTPDYGIVKP